MFSSHHPLTAGRLGELLDLNTTKAIRQAIKDLNQSYEETGRSFRVEQVAGGYQLLTLPEYHDVLQKMHQREADTKLTKTVTMIGIQAWSAVWSRFMSTFASFAQRVPKTLGAYQTEPTTMVDSVATSTAQ